MKYLVVLSVFILSIGTSSATIFAPLLNCESENPEITFRLDDHKSGSLFHGKKICAFTVDGFEERSRRASEDGFDVSFVLDNCHPDTFVQKGFLKVVQGPNQPKIINAYLLGLKNHQTLICKTTSKSAQATREKFKGLEN